MSNRADGWDDFRAPDGTITWWTRTLAELAHKVALNGDSDDRNNLKAFAQAAMAAKQLADLEEYETRIGELEEKTAHIDGLERFAAGA